MLLLDYILEPDNRAAVNLVESDDSDTPPPLRDEVIYKVSADLLDQSLFEFIGNDWWRYHGDIPATQIERQ